MDNIIQLQDRNTKMEHEILKQLYAVVVSRSEKAANGECLIYKGPYHTKSNGAQYGRVKLYINGKEERGYAHRISKLYESSQSEEAPKHLPCSHLCHDSKCVNPNHIVFEEICYNNMRKPCKDARICYGHKDFKGNTLPDCIIFN